MKRLRSENGVKKVGSTTWTTEEVFFDRLPLEDLNDVALRFELNDSGEIWIDDVRLSKLAFANSEQTELMRMIRTAEYRASKERVIDVAFMLEGYLAKLLRDEIPNDSPLLTERVALLESETETGESPDAKQENPNFFKRSLDRIKFW